MKRIWMLMCMLVVLGLIGCGKEAARNDLIAGTYIHEANDAFDEVVIVHEGNDVSVKINEVDYDAEMEEENTILVDGQYTILETYCDSEGNPDIKNCQKNRIRILNAKEWISGDYKVDNEGNVVLTLGDCEKKSVKKLIIDEHSGLL